MRITPGPVVVGPTRTRAQRSVEALMVVLLVGGLLVVAWFQVRPVLLDLGATPSERSAPLPGDELVTNASTIMTRATDLSAPPKEVWPWLVQMGVGRGGFYGYDWLENLGPAGLFDDIVNADRLHSQWQHLEVGDHVMPIPGSTSWTVVRLVRNRLLVIADDHAWSWTLVLRPAAAGSTRLVTRMSWGQTSGGAGTLGGLVFDLGDSITVARTLAGLEQRVTGTLPGMPGTEAAGPAPLARLPVGPLAAFGWLMVLGCLADASGRLLTGRRGGWLVLLCGTTVLVWCLWTDTDPWVALGAGWLATGAATSLTLLLLAHSRDGLSRTLFRALLPALCAVGLAVVLPVLTVWDAGVAVLGTGSTLRRVVVVTAAVLAGVAVSAFFWWAVGGEGTVLGLGGTVLTAVAVLTTGSVLAGAVPAALVLASLVLTRDEVAHGRPAAVRTPVVRPGLHRAR
jgi:hypothetical protein